MSKNISIQITLKHNLINILNKHSYSLFFRGGAFYILFLKYFTYDLFILLLDTIGIMLTLISCMWSSNVFTRSKIVWRTKSRRRQARRRKGDSEDTRRRRRTGTNLPWIFRNVIYHRAVFLCMSLSLSLSRAYETIYS